MRGMTSSNRLGRTLVYASLADITNRRCLDHVTDGETLDGLILRDASRAVGAADEVDVAAAVLVAAVVSSLLGLHEGSARRKVSKLGRKLSQHALHPRSRQAIHPLRAEIPPFRQPKRIEGTRIGVRTTRTGCSPW